jgi:hypothetical protein
VYGAKDGIGEPWWNYVAGVNECGSAELEDICVKNVMKQAGVNEAKVDQCYDELQHFPLHKISKSMHQGTKLLARIIVVLIIDLLSYWLFIPFQFM